jgi:hypothetical protein
MSQEDDENKRPHDSTAREPTAQRPRVERQWLAAPTGGPRHPRIGSEYQVTVLPTPISGENGNGATHRNEEIQESTLEEQQHSANALDQGKEKGDKSVNKENQV